MEIDIYQVDAFTKRLFGGNPAAVCPLKNWIDERLMLKIAKENNLAETVFFVKKGNAFEIRWFMPHAEIDLCGHATLAAAFVIFNYLDPSSEEIRFSSQSGILKAKKQANGAIELDFPSRPPQKIAIPEEIFAAFNHTPLETAVSRDIIILFKSEEEIRTLKVDLSALEKLPYLCFVPTAKGTDSDFVSRVFDPHADMVEDPVTGSAHASLIPFWAEKLEKNTLYARQLSERGGDLYCHIKEDRVFIAGNSVLFMKGKVFV